MPLDASLGGAMDGGLEIDTDRSHQILHGRQLRPRFRPAAHMIDDQSSIVLRHALRKMQIEKNSARVIYDFRSMLERLFGDSRFIRVNRNRDAQLIFESF